MTRREALRIFELDDRCTAEQVRATYRELVKVWHPDRFVNDAGLRAKAVRRLQEINRAYAVLQERSAPIASSREATRPPQVATQPSRTQSRLTRWPFAALVIISVLAGATVVGIFMMVDQPDATAEPPDPTGDAAATVSLDQGPTRKALAPLSGTDLLARPLIGKSSLIALNADRRDAVLVFVDAGVQKRAVYIRAGERLQMLDVAPGAYHIWVAAGRDWTRDHFASDQTFQEIGDPLTFANNDSRRHNITIGGPGTGARTPLRGRSEFLVTVRR